MTGARFIEWIRLYIALPYDPEREGYDAVAERAGLVAREEIQRQFDQQAGARERRGWTRAPDGTLAPPEVERQHRTADLADRIWGLRRALEEAEAEYRAYLDERTATAERGNSAPGAPRSSWSSVRRAARRSNAGPASGR